MPTKPTTKKPAKKPAKKPVKKTSAAKKSRYIEGIGRRKAAVSQPQAAKRRMVCHQECSVYPGENPFGNGRGGPRRRSPTQGHARAPRSHARPVGHRGRSRAGSAVGSSVGPRTDHAPARGRVARHPL